MNRPGSRQTTDDTLDMNDGVAGVGTISPCPSPRIESDSRDCVSKNPAISVTNMEVHNNQEAPRRNLVNQELNDTLQLGHSGSLLVDSQVGPRRTKEVDRDGGPSGRWTKMTRVDMGLTYPPSVELGKRRSTWREEEHSVCNIDDRSSKREKQTLLTDDLDIIHGLVRVVGHPCRGQ